MGNNTKLPTTKGSEENLDRRKFLKKAGLGAIALATVAGTAGLAKDVLAGEVTPISTNETKFEYVESKLGINYRDIAPSPLAEMLSQGEDEWRKNAVVRYGDKTDRYWEKGVVPKVSNGAISENMIEKLRAYTPEMLTKFTALDPNDPKYRYLWSIGTLFISEKLAG